MRNAESLTVWPSIGAIIVAPSMGMTMHAGIENRSCVGCTSSTVTNRTCVFSSKI